MQRLNIHIFVPPSNINMLVLPITWALLKTYYDHKGAYPERFYWPNPRVKDFASIDTIMQDFEKNPPDVFGFGGYIWNIKLCYEVAQRVKERWPDCLVIAGGPQPEYQSSPHWFSEHSYIDIVVPRDGEIPFTAILDRVAEGKRSFMTVPDIYLPNKTGTGTIKSLNTVDNREFSWPASPLIHESEFLSKIAKEAYDANMMSFAFLETARGCPYQCTFCDWGGGTYTKVRLKDMDMVRAELEWLADNKINYVHVTDANFGMFPRDVDIAKLMAEIKNRTGWPKTYTINNAKQNAERTIDITTILFKAGLIHEYTLSLQDTDGDVLKYIKRIDLPWEKNLERARRLMANGVPVIPNLISGLPGWNEEKFFNSVDNLLEADLTFPRNFPFLLLPNSPAAEPAYMDEHKIVTVKRFMEAYPVSLRSDITDDVLENLNLNEMRVVKDRNQDNSIVDFVISTKWYSTEELFYLRTVNSIIYSGQTAGIFYLITKRLHDEAQVKYSDFYKDLMDNFFSKPEACGEKWTRILTHLQGHYQRWLDGDTMIWEVTTPLDDRFPFAICPELYWSWHSYVYHEDLFPRLKTYLLSKYQIKDLDDTIDQNYFMMITPDYNPIIGKQQSFKQDWVSNHSNPVTITIRDRYYNNRNEPGTGAEITWHQYQDRDSRILNWFYQVLYGVKARRWHLCYDLTQEKICKDLEHDG